MPEVQSNKDRLKEITASIEDGIKNLFESDKYQQYLTTMSRFHKYSVNNTMLIFMQKPDATVVAGFNKWKDQFGRNVMKGERGIKIIAPTPYKKMIEQDKLDPDTNLPMKDADGRIITEIKEIKIPMFKPVTVFDVSQTDGKPPPQLASDLQGNVQNYDVFMEALKRSAPVSVAIEPMAANMDGYFDTKHRDIHIREGMSEVQTVSATVHEIAHSKLHDYRKNELLDSKDDFEDIEILGHDAVFSNWRIDRSKLPEGLYCYDLRGSDDDPGQYKFLEEHVLVNHAGCVITAEPITLPEDGRIDISDEMGFNGGVMTLRKFYEDAYPDKAKKSRNTEEVEAESISFAVCAYYGIATGENSFGYIATWSKGKELSELRESLETINKTASSLITDIDRNYAEIMKERGLDKVAPEQTTPEFEDSAVEPNEGLFLLDNMTYLHLQPTDGGYDYSLYDKESMKLMDGGVYEDNDLPERSARALTVARVEILALHGLASEKVDKVTLDVLEQIQAANEVAAPYFEYKLHANPRASGEKDAAFIQAYEHKGGEVYPADIIGYGTYSAFIPLVNRLNEEKIKPADAMQITDEYAYTPPAPEVERGVEEAPAETAPDNGYLPDPTMSIEAMNAYGYTDADMLPLSKERALELFERDITVFMLYEGNSEGMAFEAEDIALHTGIFGVSREDWEKVKDSIPPMEVKPVDKQYEADFLSSPENGYCIYQLNDTPESAELRFMGSNYLQEKGYDVVRSNYNAIYGGALASSSDTMETLNELYTKFNIDHPADFKGHSLSVSDIVALKQDGVVSCHYVDSFVFKELPTFLRPENYLKNAEMAMEDDYGMIDGVINNGPKLPTVAELEQQAKERPISLLDLAEAVRREQKSPAKQPETMEKKASVLAKLRQYLADDKSAATMHKRAERDL